jgi:cation diffusion facilitator family transporter
MTAANGHDHDHGHSHDDGHDHEHPRGALGWLMSALHLHGHSHQKQELAADTAFAATSEGIRTVWLALALLGLTTAIQVTIVLWSGSVALLADTIHNFGDALNSLPLLVAFYLSRRAATRRYTYGFGRAEDVAGIFIVLSIAVSAGVIFWESAQKLLNPGPMTNLPWVAAAAVIGFLGNEAVATIQIRAGRRIGSAAMVADGQHARTDGFTSLAVLLAAGATWLGFPILDPIIGLLIGVTILFITWDATKTIWYRLMDAVDPELVAEVEHTAQHVKGVEAVSGVRVRWVGHTLHANLHITVDEDLTTRASHAIAHEVEHTLGHALPRLASVAVHVEPCGHGGPAHPAHTEHQHHATEQAATGLA